MKIILTDIMDLSVDDENEYKVIKANENVRNCIGCFGCWVKTPGQCIIKDGYDRLGIDLKECTDLIIISRCCFGSISPEVKIIQERAIGYLNPDFVIRNGEMHHKRRYDNVITISAYFYGEDINDAEKTTARNLVSGIVDNYDGKIGNVEFYKTATELKSEVAL